MTFVKGKIGNPRGRPKEPGDIKTARHLTRWEFERIINKYLYLTRTQLEEKLADPKTKIIELMVGRMCVATAGTADPRRFEFILDRIIGRVPQRVEIIEEYEIYKPPKSIANDNEVTREGVTDGTNSPFKTEGS